MNILQHRLSFLFVLCFLSDLFTNGKEYCQMAHTRDFAVPFQKAYCTVPVIENNPDTLTLVDLSRQFTKMENQHVNVPTPGLFDGRTSFELDLDEIDSCEWCYPVPTGKVISHYGGSRKSHSGTDIKAPRGEKILAAFDGVVRFSGTYSAYGKMIVVRHANGLETCYAHNKKNLVKVGDVVKAGDAIALVGRTGRASTEHCHFEVRVNGQAINSNNLFDHSSHRLKTGILIFKKSGRRVIVKSR